MTRWPLIIGTEFSYKFSLIFKPTPKIYPQKMEWIVVILFKEKRRKKAGNPWLRTAVLNLGYAYPWGYAINSQGVRKQLAVRLKNTQYMAIVVFNLIKIKKLPFLATIN